jgi:enterochelin esterase-like enzyme
MFIKMKSSALFLLVALTSFFSIFSQPGHEDGFSFDKDIIYSRENNQILLLDLYLPKAANLPSGIGVTGKDQNRDTAGESIKTVFPVIIWIGKAGTGKFPSPIASYVGNGYAVVSLQVKSQSEILKNAGQAMKYLKANAAKNNLDISKTGFIICISGGYKALVMQIESPEPWSMDNPLVQMQILADRDSAYLGLQSKENTSKLIGFFDKHLRNGIHKKSDPYSLTCPADSWADPITNPLPGTTYHLFPTPARGENKQGSYLIYLPRDYSTSGKRYPVIYWLHGGNGNSREGAWMCEQMDAAMKKGTMPQCIVVFVQGLPIGWYNNAKDGTMPVEDVIIHDLIPHIDSTYRTLKLREARAIEGMSMGGYGSLHLGFKYPELFGVVSSIAPSITSFEMERKEVVAPTFEDDTAYFNANSPSVLIQNHAAYIGKNTTIRLLVGDHDFLFDVINKFHQLLTDLQINHQYAIAKAADHDYKEVISKLGFNSFTFWDTAFERANNSR